MASNDAPGAVAGSPGELARESPAELGQHEVIAAIGTWQQQWPILKVPCPAPGSNALPPELSYWDY